MFSSKLHCSLRIFAMVCLFYALSFYLEYQFDFLTDLDTRENLNECYFCSEFRHSHVLTSGCATIHFRWYQSICTSSSFLLRFFCFFLFLFRLQLGIELLLSLIIYFILCLIGRWLYLKLSEFEKEKKQISSHL